MSANEKRGPLPTNPPADRTRRAILGGLTAGILLRGNSAFMARRVINVRDYGAKGDGVTDDTRAVRSAQAAAVLASCVLDFPAGTYAISGWKDISDEPVMWRSTEGATVICHHADIRFISRFSLLSVTGSNPRKTSILHADAPDLQKGAMIFLSAQKVVEMTRREPIACQLFSVDASGKGWIALDEPLAFNFQAGDSNLICRLYRNPRSISIEGIRFVTASDNSNRALSLMGVAGGLTFKECSFETQHKGDINLAPDGVMLLESMGVTSQSINIRNCRYGFMLTNGSRDCSIVDVFSSANRHPIYTAYWASRCTFRRIRGRNNIATIDSHSAFDISYYDVTASDDMEMSNLRSAGAHLENALIISRSGGMFRASNQAWTSEYQEIYHEHTVSLINVTLRFRQRTNPGKPAIWIGRTKLLILRDISIEPKSFPVSIAERTPLITSRGQDSNISVIRRPDKQ